MPTKLRHEVIQPLNKPYRYIPLTQGQNAIVDVADFEWLSQWKWQAQFVKATKTWMAVHNMTGGSTVLMHRLIVSTPPWLDCDHRNHDSLDNRRENLRSCTVTQNIQNQRIRKRGYKGVHKRSNVYGPSWRSVIRVNKRLLHIGTFVSPEKAAKAYDNAARRYFGAFACLNFPS